MRRFFLMLLAPLALLGCNEPSGSSRRAAEPTSALQAEPSRFDLGAVKPGSQHERKLSLKNVGTQVVEIGPIETSCDCLSIELPKRKLEPGETITATLLIDLAKEGNDFSGGLTLLATGKTSDGRVAFEIRCDVNVLKL